MEDFEFGDTALDTQLYVEQEDSQTDKTQVCTHTETNSPLPSIRPRDKISIHTILMYPHLINETTEHKNKN